VRVLLVDNFDSFVWNLAQAIGALGAEPAVVRNDAVDPARLAEDPPDRVVISPGPRGPGEAGASVAVIRAVAGRVPVLGVCLGHQCIAEAFGGRVVRAPGPRHGKTSPIRHDGLGVLRGVPSPTPAARYHSLAVEESSLPASLLVTARSDDGVVMGLRHREWAVEGVQFHPESFLTPAGPTVLRNFLEGSR
jgi:anthranilate synthase/aminodeoxychorismate synthase-like glutamine amidotransferase